VYRIGAVSLTDRTRERSETMTRGANRMTRRRVGSLPAALLVCSSVLIGSATGAAAQPPDPDKASCVEQFNLAVGTPGEYQRIFHQEALGRDVSVFARLSEEDCPF
jgi:hypothetical protein